MAKTNDTTTFPITAPAAADLLFGTDVSNTSNSPDGETVNFTVEDVLNYMASGGTGAPKIQTAGIEDDAVNLSKIDLNSATYSGSLASSGIALITIPSNYAFFPRWTSSSGDVVIELFYDGRIRFRNSGDTNRTYSITFRWIQ